MLISALIVFVCFACLFFERSHLATSEFFEDCVTSSLDKVIAGIRSLHDAPFDPEPAMTSLVFDAIYSLFFGSRFGHFFV